MSAPNDALSSAPAAAPTVAPGNQPGSGEIQVADEPQIAIDPQAQDVDDAASDIGSSVASSKTSLAESIYNFRVENGRTYHRYKDGSKHPPIPSDLKECFSSLMLMDEEYFYPNDEKESDRLDLQHHLFLLSLEGKLGLSPPNEEDYKVKRVLDVGTGTGIWAIEFGDIHPEAEIIGVDLSPPQAEVPPNVRFEVDDIEEPWLFSRPFDYIHSRMMTSSISNWKQFVQRAYDNLTPGGYLELQEIDLLPQSDDGTLGPDAAIVRSSVLLGQAATLLNRSFQDIPDLVNVMRNVGFIDIHIKKIKWPTNTWPADPRYKLLGEWAHENCMSGIEGWIMAPLTRALGWKKEEVQVFLVEIRKELRDRSIHAYWPAYALYGKKPEVDGQES